MKRILLVLTISVLAITARGSLVLVSVISAGNTYDPSAAYPVSGSFGGSVPIAGSGGPIYCIGQWQSGALSILG